MKTYSSFILLFFNTSVAHGSVDSSNDNLLKSMSLHTYAKSSKISKSSSKKKLSRSQCVDPNVPEFIIDSNQDIGDVLIHHDGPGFARKCGTDCYLVKDNGDDPPYDPEAGDTLRFAYKKITSYNFSLRALVCGVACDGEGSYFGRTGIMVRDSLDPFARNVFVSHSPNDQAGK